jgi:hypothetical protein
MREHQYFVAFRRFVSMPRSAAARSSSKKGFDNFADLNEERTELDATIEQTIANMAEPTREAISGCLGISRRADEAVPGFDRPASRAEDRN